MSISLHFEKYNAVITVVAPCKYVSPQIQWPGRTTEGEMKQVGENDAANEERDEAAPCCVCPLMLRQRKARKRQEGRP